MLVPILVHLFDFRRAKKLLFSSIQFISKFSTKAKSVSRLKYLLILSSRLFIFLSVIAFTYLIITIQGKSSELDIAIYYDNSFSSAVSSKGIMPIDFLTKGSIVYFDNDERQLRSVSDLVLSDPSLTDGTFNSRLSSVLSNGSNLTYVLSDFQLQDSDNLRSMLSDSSKRFHLAITQDINLARNVSVDTLYIQPNPDNLTELKIIVVFSVYNITDGNIVVKLMDSGKQLSSLVRDISELDILEFSIPKSEFGNYLIKIDGDDVVFDNSFYFSIGEQVKPWITIINESGFKFVDAVYGNSELFNRDFQSLSNLDYERLSKSSLIVLGGVKEIPSGIIEQLDVPLLIFPPGEIDKENYSGTLGISIEKSERLVLNELDIDFNHPLLRGVFDENNDEQDRQTANVFSRISGEYETIIPFRGGTPFLLKTNKAYFFNTSFIGEHDEFHTKALFLPILYQIAFSENNRIESAYLYPGDLLRIRGTASDTPPNIIGADYEVIPSFSSDGRDLILEIPSTIDPGFYTLVHAGDTLKNIAINIPKSESIMKAPTLEQLEKAFEDYDHVTVTSLSDKGGILNAGVNSKSSLWKYALILTLLFVLTETMLHRYLK